MRGPSRRFGYNQHMDSTSPSESAVARIGPDDRPFTLAEVQENVAVLIREFEGDPGVNLLNIVAAMLAQTHCTCAPVPGPGATVTALPTRAETALPDV